MVQCRPELSQDLKKPVLPITTTAEPVGPQRNVPDLQSQLEWISSQSEAQDQMLEQRKDQIEVKSPPESEQSTTSPIPVGPSTATRWSQLLIHAPVKRARNKGHVRSNVAAQLAVPVVFMNAMVNDRLWTKQEVDHQHDSLISSSSMSSSSSISSNDTVIDLSLPNLARERLTSLPSASGISDTPWVGLLSLHCMPVNKSKSNPNIQQSHECQPCKLQPSQQYPGESPGRPTHRRHTWSRLYMEELKMSLTAKTSAKVGVPGGSGSMSKSLGDLTSDDISSNFDSKYRSISRSFIQRPTKEQLRQGGPRPSWPLSTLTEQLRRLADVEPLTASDFNPECTPCKPWEQVREDSLVRRTSSRSQSRVRYIANRAKRAQERKRLQGLVQGLVQSQSSSGSRASPIEERGNPEGACSVARSPCSSLDLLSQLAPFQPPSTATQSQSSPDPEIS